MARFMPGQGIVQAHGVGKLTKYLQVRMQHNGEDRRVYVHRLVCEAFHGPCPEGYECDHRDEDTRNNRADNLRWLPRAQNVRRADRNINFDKEGLAL